MYIFDGRHDFLQLARYADYYEDCSERNLEAVFVLESNLKGFQLKRIIIGDHFLEYYSTAEGESGCSLNAGRPGMANDEEVAQGNVSLSQELGLFG